MGLGRETIEVRGTHPIEGPWYHPDSSLMLFHLGHHSFLVTARCIPLFGNTMFYLFISWWTFDVFPLFGYGESCHYEHLCTRFCVNTHFPFFGYLPGGGITGHVVILCWTFWGTSRFYALSTAFYIPPPSSVWGSNFPMSIIPNSSQEMRPPPNKTLWLPATETTLAY